MSADAPASPLAALFDRVARDYDAGRRMLVPCFDAFYGAAVAAVGPLAPGARVLDLGAGTGLFAAMLAARSPGLRFVLTDLSAAMLEEARARLARLGAAEPEIRIADHRGPLPDGPFDAVVSALSIHHMEHADQRALLVRLAALLPPGAVFVNAEQVAGTDADAEAALDRDWERQARALGAGDAVISAARARMAHDRCAPLPVALGWMETAGFAADCPFAEGRFAVLRGRRRG